MKSQRWFGSRQSHKVELYVSTEISGKQKVTTSGKRCALRLQRTKLFLARIIKVPPFFQLFLYTNKYVFRHERIYLFKIMLKYIWTCEFFLLHTLLNYEDISFIRSHEKDLKVVEVLTGADLEDTQSYANIEKNVFIHIYLYTSILLVFSLIHLHTKEKRNKTQRGKVKNEGKGKHRTYEET